MRGIELLVLAGCVAIGLGGAYALTRSPAVAALYDPLEANRLRCEAALPGDVEKFQTVIDQHPELLCAPDISAAR